MKEHTHEFIPDPLKVVLDRCLTEQSIDANKLVQFLQIVQFHDNSRSAAYALREIKLKQPYRDYRYIRFFYCPSEKNILAYGYLVLKKVDETIHIIPVNEKNGSALEMIISYLAPERGIKFLRASVLKSDCWDSLAVYQNFHVHAFYEKQNNLVATLLSNIITEVEKQQLVLDLGCGTGEIYARFSQVHTQKNVNWLGIDFSEINIDTAKKKSGISAFWMKSDATTVVDKIQFPENLDIYVIASGLMTAQVLNFEQSLAVMQSLRRVPNLKKVMMTGLTALYISPYIAKQMGFIRTAMIIDPKLEYDSEVFCYVAQPLAQQVDRFIAKANKHQALDLSYIPDNEFDTVLSKIIQRKGDLKNIDSLVLAGISLTSARIQALQPLFEHNRQLLVYCAALNQQQKNQMDAAIEHSEFRLKFISQPVITAYPIYSPAFFKDIHAGIALPLVSSAYRNANDPNVLLGFKGIVLEQLFRALNEHRTQKKELSQEHLAALYALHQVIHQQDVSLSDETTQHYSPALLQAYQQYKTISTLRDTTEPAFKKARIS